MYRCTGEQNKRTYDEGYGDTDAILASTSGNPWSVVYCCVPHVCMEVNRVVHTRYKRVRSTCHSGVACCCSAAWLMHCLSACCSRPIPPDVNTGQLSSSVLILLIAAVAFTQDPSWPASLCFQVFHYAVENPRQPCDPRVRVRWRGSPHSGMAASNSCRWNGTAWCGPVV